MYIKDSSKRSLGEKFYSDTIFRSEDVSNINFSTTSTSFTDVTGSTISLILDKAINVIILFEGTVYSAVPAALLYAVLAVNLDGTNLVPRIVGSLGTTTEHEMGQFTRLLAVGSHTIKLQMLTENAASAAVLSGGNLSVLFLSE